MEKYLTFSQLVPSIPEQVAYQRVADAVSPVRGIVYDSRKVQPGDIFVALGGGNTDGHRYIPDAIRRGARAVVGMQPMPGLAVDYLQVRDSRKALAYLSAAYYAEPARKLQVIGVTGTDGKTTTVNLLFHILRAAGIQAGLISTVNAVIGDQVLDTGFHVTTPESPDVQRYLAQMVSAGLTHVVLETTSHGLDQQRVAACEFDVALVTNITHEHLDYHGIYAAYRAAKARLFTGLADTRPKPFKTHRGAVINRDDSSYQYLREQVPTGLACYSYGFDPEADLRATNLIFDRDGMRFTVERRYPSNRIRKLPIATRLIGKFNVMNCLAAITATWAIMGLSLKSIQQGIHEMPGVPGRMEKIDLGQDFIALVDFAHTPNALRVALETVRQVVQASDPPGRLIAVFGSAGLRDRQKRRMMAEVAIELADCTVFTAEDPRTESLDGILAEMAAGAQAHGGVEGESYWRIPDRGDALRFAVSLAQPGDLVITCGKGHEQSMCFGEIEYPWDDRTALRAALAERLGITGYAMPALPTTQINP